MKARRKYFGEGAAAQDFWPSFTDVMSTLALILFFLMLLAYVQNIIYGNNLENARQQLEIARADISSAERELRFIRLEIDKTRTALALSEQEIENQKAIIALSNEELQSLRVRLQSIAFLRLDILQKVKESVEKELGKYNEKGQELVTIGDNANIIINESMVFAFNSYKLRPEAKELLTQLSKAFERVLENPETRENIDAISIEGHTDSLGNSDYNRELSARRATEVVNYMFSVNPNLEAKYGKYFAANGFSKFRPINTGSDEESRAANRRIEISIIIKDSNIQKVIEKYFDETKGILESR
ncbi:MAG TPA: OmpA family protein [Bacillota bacterium]|nr:OmpA family protein [Bacillota bacterium]HPL53283.1 OmpA family protein [Bacillota bacterium]